MLVKNKINLYDASAGSGKTYTLVKEIVTILLQSPKPDAFKNVLAVTFTNKAANEMKERILEDLHEFSSDQYASSTKLQDIAQDLNVDIDVLHERSKAILSSILHNYSQFAISTIDKFNLRLMRSFAADLGLSMNFDVEMNVEELLNESVDIMFSQLEEDGTLTQILSELALDNLTNDKYWDLSRDMVGNAKLLMKDQFLNEIDKLKNIPLEDFNDFRQELGDRLKKIEKQLKSNAKQVLNEVENLGLSEGDFYGGANKAIVKFFQKHANGNLAFPTTTHEEVIEEEKYTSGKANADAKAKIEAYFPTLKSRYYESLELLIERNFWEKIYSTSKPFTVFNEIDKVVDEIKMDNNLLLISDFNEILSKNLKKQSVDFIYERIGNRFENYFVDEFQDTSRLQWENLTPLLDNALAQDDTVMIVGDPKQSIYRFKGGDTNLMLELMNGEKALFIMFL